MIKFMNITYSDELNKAFTVWRPSILPFEMDIALPFGMNDKIRDEQLPYDFEKWETPSNFLSNFWDDIFYYFIIFMIYAIVWISKIALLLFKV